MYEDFNYQWLKDAQGNENYRIEFYYASVVYLTITKNRIREAMKSGDHYVTAEQVLQHFEKGMKLLDPYYSMPDRLT